MVYFVLDLVELLFSGRTSNPRGSLGTPAAASSTGTGGMIKGSWKNLWRSVITTVSVLFFLVGFKTICLKAGLIERISDSFRSFLSPAIMKKALGCMIFSLFMLIAI